MLTAFLFDLEAAPSTASTIPFSVDSAAGFTTLPQQLEQPQICLAAVRPKHAKPPVHIRKYGGEVVSPYPSLYAHDVSFTYIKGYSK